MDYFLMNCFKNLLTVQVKVINSQGKEVALTYQEELQHLKTTWLNGDQIQNNYWICILFKLKLQTRLIAKT